jgi:hypothetical protein
MTCRGDPVEMTRVQWYEATGSIKDVDGHGAARIGMADRCREHGGQPDLCGQAQQPGGMPEAGRGARRPAMTHHLDDHPAARQQVDPPAQEHARPIGTAGQQGLAHVRARPEQDHQSQRSGPWVDGMLGNKLCAADGSSTFTTEVGLGHQTTQPAPTDAGVDPGALPTRQHRDPRVPGIDLGAAPDWIGPTSADPTCLNSLPGNGIGKPVPHSQVHPEHRSDACLVAGLHEAHRSVQSVAVGQGQRRLALRAGEFHQRRRGRCAVTQREAGRDVQVGKGVTHYCVAVCRVAVCRVAVGCAVTAMNSGNGRLMGRPSAP